MKGSVGDKLRNRFRSWPVERWISLLVGFTGVFLLICILWIVFRILRIVLISPLVAMVKTVAQGAWGFVFEAIPALFKSRTVAPPAFRKACRRAHWGILFYLLQYLTFLGLVKSGVVVGFLGWILIWYAILAMGLSKSRYFTLLWGLYQFYHIHSNRLPESDGEWQTILKGREQELRAREGHQYCQHRRRNSSRRGARRAPPRE